MVKNPVRKKKKIRQNEFEISDKKYNVPNLLIFFLFFVTLSGTITIFLFFNVRTNSRGAEDSGETSNQPLKSLQPVTDFNTNVYGDRQLANLSKSKRPFNNPEILISRTANINKNSSITNKNSSEVREKALLDKKLSIKRILRKNEKETRSSIGFEIWNIGFVGKSEDLMPVIKLKLPNSKDDFIYLKKTGYESNFEIDNREFSLKVEILDYETVAFSLIEK